MSDARYFSLHLPPCRRRVMTLSVNETTSKIESNAELLPSVRVVPSFAGSSLVCCHHIAEWQLNNCKTHSIFPITIPRLLLGGPLHLPGRSFVPPQNRGQWRGEFRKSCHSLSSEWSIRLYCNLFILQDDERRGHERVSGVYFLHSLAYPVDHSRVPVSLLIESQPLSPHLLISLHPRANVQWYLFTHGTGLGSGQPNRFQHGCGLVCTHIKQCS